MTASDAATRVLGTGLAVRRLDQLSLGVDLVLAEGPRGTDLALVLGPDNLAQCLRTALTTALGEDVFNTTFGFDGLRALTEPLSTSETADLLGLAMRRTLAADGRIAQVLEVTVERAHEWPRRWAVSAVVRAVHATAPELLTGEIDG